MPGLVSYLKPYITQTFRKAFKVTFIYDEIVRRTPLRIRSILKFNFAISKYT